MFEKEKVYLMIIGCEDKMSDSIELNNKEFYGILKILNNLKTKKLKSKKPVIKIVSPDYVNGKNVGITYYFDFNEVSFTLIHFFKRL